MMKKRFIVQTGDSSEAFLYDSLEEIEEEGEFGVGDQVYQILETQKYKNGGFVKVAQEEQDEKTMSKL